MNVSDMMREALAIDPMRSYCGNYVEWLHCSGIFAGAMDTKTTEFELSVLPGFNGTDCQTFREKSPQEVIAKFTKAYELRS